MMNGVLRQMELAALPGCAAQHRLARRAQARMIVGDHELHTAHAAFKKAFQKRSPVNLGLGHSAGDTENATPS